MEDEKLSGRIIIDTVLENMRQQVEELRYTKIVPAAFDVYLHADDQQRLESLAHEIAAEAVRALQERLDALNRETPLDRVRTWVRQPRLPYRKVGPWLVRMAQDPEGGVPRGRALVVSQITLATAESYEGQRTRRLATLSAPPAASPESAAGAGARVASPPPSEPGPVPNVAASDTAARERLAAAGMVGTVAREGAPEPAQAPALAVLAWEDESGPHRFAVTQPEVTVGRATRDSTADVRLATAPDVSRIHLRLRYDAQSRRFTIEDSSLLGTKVDGEPLERGAPRELPARSEIRLADTITLRFEREALP